MCSCSQLYRVIYLEIAELEVGLSLMMETMAISLFAFAVQDGTRLQVRWLIAIGLSLVLRAYGRGLVGSLCRRKGTCHEKCSNTVRYSGISESSRVSGVHLLLAPLHFGSGSALQRSGRLSAPKIAAVRAGVDGGTKTGSSCGPVQTGGVGHRLPDLFHLVSGHELHAIAS